MPIKQSSLYCKMWPRCYRNLEETENSKFYLRYWDEFLSENNVARSNGLKLQSKRQTDLSEIIACPQNTF